MAQESVYNTLRAVRGYRIMLARVAREVSRARRVPSAARARRWAMHGRVPACRVAKTWTESDGARRRRGGWRALARGARPGGLAHSNASSFWRTLTGRCALEGPDRRSSERETRLSGQRAGGEMAVGILIACGRQRLFAASLAFAVVAVTTSAIAAAMTRQRSFARCPTSLRARFA